MRGFCFNYAGKSSLDFNLIFCYVGNSPDSVVSGGEYELSTDSLPYLTEQLLYGKKYETPLEFEVEIINPDSTITVENLRKIKRWLFGQDGWKKLKINDPAYTNYFLRCLFIPKEDIIDSTGYRGLRCTLRNSSPYWYGKPVIVRKTIDQLRDDESSRFGKWFDINIHSDNDDIITPIIRMKTKANVSYDMIELATIEHQHMTYDDPGFNAIRDFPVSFIRANPSGHSGDVFTIDTKYLQGYFIKTPTDENIQEIKESGETRDYVKLTPNIGKPPLFFKKGDNILQISCFGNNKATPQSDIFEWIEIEYEPKIALGGF